MKFWNFFNISVRFCSSSSLFYKDFFFGFLYFFYRLFLFLYELSEHFRILLRFRWSVPFLSFILWGTSLSLDWNPLLFYLCPFALHLYKIYLKIYTLYCVVLPFLKVVCFYGLIIICLLLFVNPYFKKFKIFLCFISMFLLIYCIF